MFRARMKAISPVIATIIIVAVTIAIAVAVAGWLMGLWSGYTNTPALSINTATLYNDTGTLVMLVSNTGTGDAVFQYVEAGGIACTSPTAIYVDGSQVTSYSAVVIKPGAQNVNVTVVCDKWAGAFTPGQNVEVRVILKTGQTATAWATVKAGSP